ASLPARRREAHPKHEVVQPALERDQQRLPGHARLLQHAVEDVAELALRQPVDALHLLLFAQLARVVGRLSPPAGGLAVLARRVGAPLDGALPRETARPLEEELRPLAAAPLADPSGVAGHASDPALLGRAARVLRNRRDV